MFLTCRRRFLGISLVSLAACAEGHQVDLGGSDGGTDADIGVDYDAAEEFKDCGEEDTSSVPDSLVCTGLYASLLRKNVDETVLEFAPAHPLWSDGAEKRRWIQLPKGEKIDNSDPNGWIFPVGTKLWKEFKVGNKRVETRLFWKVSPTFWQNGTYEWNADESEAISSLGGDIDVNGEPYHLPTDGECQDCHKGQPDKVLGFSAVNLGLEGATGITLKELWEAGLLTEKPPLLELSIGEDRTGLDDDGLPLAAKALGILHTNCGQTCHNQTPRAKANLSKQNLRLDSTVLDGRAPDEALGVIATAVGHRAEGVQWNDHPFRILPGDPANSLIYQLMSHRDPTNMGRGQMPPIATRKVDTEAVKVIEKWILRLGAGNEPSDAGESMDAGTVTDASVPIDAGTGPDMDSGVDAASAAGSTLDAGEDAGHDAGEDAGVDAEVDAGDDALDAGADASADSDASVEAADAEQDADI
jgi:hypothetical protein